MYSKRTHLIALLLLLFTTASCSYFFGEKKNKSNTYNLSISEKANVGCIEKNTALLSDYFEMKQDDAQIAAELRDMGTCINDAIKLFVKHTRGGNADSYTPSEIHEFLVSVFKSYSYSFKLMEDAALLKDSLLGGGQYVISKEEVKILPQYVTFVYQALADLAPYRHLLFSQRQTDKWEDFPKASEKLIKVMQRFKNLPQKKSGTFDYAGMVRLAEYFLDDDFKENHWPKTFDLVNSIQALLAKGQRDQVDINKVNPIIDQLVPMYLSYMEFHKFLKDDVSLCSQNDQDCLKQDFFKDFSTVFTFPALVTRLIENPEPFTNRNIEILTSIQMRILNTLRDSLEANNGVSIDYVYDLIATLTRIEALPDFIKASTLNSMAPQFFGFWLSKKPCSARCNDIDIRAEQVDALIEIVNGWRERQLWINSYAESGQFFRKDQSRGQLKKSKRFTGELLDFQEALEAVNHTHWSNYVHIGVNEVNYKDLVIFNKLYTLIKMFLAPFNNNTDKSNVLDYFLTQQQTQYFYEWFRPLGLELKLLDPRSRSSGKQTFIEINLFGSNSSKPTQLDLAEVIEYFEIAISTGQRTDYLMNNKFVKCRQPGTMDVFNYERLDAICFREEFHAQAHEYFFSTLPLMMNYFSTNKTTEKEEEYDFLLKVLEKAGRQGLIANTAVDTDAIRVMSSIIQYGESLFLRFNTEGNDDVITTEELKRAMTHIVPNLKRLIEESLDPATIKVLYQFFPRFEENLVTYMLRYSEIPGILTAETSLTTGTGLAQLKLFKEWSELAPSWMQKDARVKREDIMLVISGLSAFARVTKVKNLKKIFVDNELQFTKGYSDVNDKVFEAIAAELSCSTLKDQEIRQWLFENQDRYWKETLQYFDVKVGGFNVLGFQFGGTKAQLSSNDIPQTGLFAGWEGAVTTKLIEHMANDPIGQFCGLPYIESIHDIQE
jgi:hypothetical protein